MGVKKVIEIDVHTEEGVKNVKTLNKNIEGTEKQTEATKKATDGLLGSLDRMTGGAITAFRGIVSGAKNGVMAMRSLKVAMAATGIGLLVVAVGTLVSYFTNTQRGADLVSKSFKAIGVTVSVLIDRVSGFGEGLALIFSGKFREGADILKESIKGIGKEIKDESKAAYDLEDALHKVEDREIALIGVNAKRRAQIDKLRLAAEDETKSNKERAAALQEAVDIQNKITNDEIAIAKEKARISRENLALGESSREEIRENALLQARVIELESERDRSLRTVTTRLNAFRDAQGEANEVIRQRAEIQSVGNAGLTPDGIKAGISAEEQLQKGSLAVIQRYAKLRKQEAEGAANFEIWKEQQVKDQKLNLYAATAGAIATILGRNSKLGKAAGIAQATINTYQGITEVWKTVSTLPEPAATINKIASTLTVAASGFAAVRNIASVQLPFTAGGGGGGGATPNISAPPTPSFNLVGNSQANQLAGALNQNDQPIKAYVVSRNMTTQQEMDRNIRNTASVG
jgi:hypothetical protein